jgi:hypothetical protein
LHRALVGWFDAHVGAEGAQGADDTRKARGKRIGAVNTTRAARHEREKYGKGRSRGIPSGINVRAGERLIRAALHDEAPLASLGDDAECP